MDAGLLELVLFTPSQLPHLRQPAAAAVGRPPRGGQVGPAEGEPGADHGASSDSTDPASDAQRAFLRLVDMAFSSRRKMIRNNLQADYEPEVVDAALEAIGLSRAARPQELSSAQFVDLYNALPPS